MRVVQYIAVFLAVKPSVKNVNFSTTFFICIASNSAHVEIQK